MLGNNLIVLFAKLAAATLQNRGNRKLWKSQGSQIWIKTVQRSISNDCCRGKHRWKVKERRFAKKGTTIGWTVSTRILCSIIDGRVAIASVRILLRGASLRRVRSIHPSSSGQVLCAFKQISQETFSTSNSVEWPLNLSGSAFMLFTRVEREIRNEDVDEGTK